MTAALLSAALCLSVLALLWVRRREKRTLRRLDEMLAQAARGDWSESDFDESLLSAVEGRFAQYLSAAAVSARQVEGERRRLQELVGDIAHQTRTPLANLLLYTQLLEEQPLPPASRTCAAALGTQADKLRALIEALVKLSRLETGVLALHPVQGEIAPMIERAAEQIRPAAAQKEITLIWGGQEGQRAWFDPKWTEEAVVNLLDNAVKYTPAGGEIRVTVTPYELFCRIDVADTGPGIPEGEQARIFGRFYRAPGAREQAGVGVGLYLVRQIAAGQGGYVRVRSRPGEGTVFSLFLSREQILQKR